MIRNTKRLVDGRIEENRPVVSMKFNLMAIKTKSKCLESKSQIQHSQ
jgi:hypothetical protein